LVKNGQIVTVIMGGGKVCIENVIKGSLVRDSTDTRSANGSQIIDVASSTLTEPHRAVGPRRQNWLQLRRFGT